jgi:hypothetical protein
MHFSTMNSNIFSELLYHPHICMAIFLNAVLAITVSSVTLPVYFNYIYGPLLLYFKSSVGMET